MPESAIELSTVSRSVTCAIGVYAPGHLGELTQHVPFELVDAVLVSTRTVQHRLRVLPSALHDRAGLEQEICALLTVYQVLRIVMVEAVESRPGLDPDRASFTIALQAARDQLTAAAGLTFDDQQDPPDLLGTIGRDGLGGILPARRARYSTPQGQERHRALARPRHRPASAHDDDHHHRGGPTTAAGDRPTQEAHPDPTTGRTDPPRASHHAHGDRSGTRMARQRPRQAARHQDPEHAHTARRVDPARLPGPNRPRHLRTTRPAVAATSLTSNTSC